MPRISYVSISDWLGGYGQRKKEKENFLNKFELSKKYTPSICKFTFGAGRVCTRKDYCTKRARFYEKFVHFI